MPLVPHTLHLEQLPENRGRNSEVEMAVNFAPATYAILPVVLNFLLGYVYQLVCQIVKNHRF